mmetsp:Transcript_30395/g.34552  ORF Transcript_30395/g.34552 Transcript_30395/m.34552 type:complete len:289 (-) Transcript_30395:215-1081(-)
MLHKSSPNVADTSKDQVLSEVTPPLNLSHDDSLTHGNGGPLGLKESPRITDINSSQFEENYKLKTVVQLTKQNLEKNAHDVMETKQDTCLLWLTRLYYSRACSAFYVTLIALNLFSIFWIIIHPDKFPGEIWFLGLEVFITLMIVGEVVARMKLQGWKKFWKLWTNIFDVIVTFACCLIVILLIGTSSFIYEIEGLSAEFLFACRNIVVFMRLVSFVKNQRKTQQSMMNMIDFSQLGDEEIDYEQVDFELEMDKINDNSRQDSDPSETFQQSNTKTKAQQKTPLNSFK